MVHLTGYRRVIFDLRKLENYCLNPAHSRGRHKARVFREALGIGRADAIWLQSRLLESLESDDAVELGADSFGTRWRIDVAVARQERKAVVRTIWMVEADEDTVRFLTCWVL